jgi:hypothetical protein
MGRAYSRNKGEEESMNVIDGNSRKKETSRKKKDVGGWIILKCILLSRMWWYGLDWSDSGYGPLESFCECCNEPSGFIKCWEILEGLHNWCLSSSAQLHRVRLR